MIENNKNIYAMYPYGYGSGYAREDDEQPAASDKHWCSADGHVPVNTGLLKGWCKYCNVTMWFDRTLGKYTTEDPFKK